MRTKTNHGLTRRALMRGVLAATTAGMASRIGMPALALAADARETTRRFVFAYFPGGWDQLLFLDPRDPTKFDDKDRSTTLTETRYAALEGYNGFTSQIIRAKNLTFGPAAEKPLLPAPKLSTYADRIAIVRGINMGTLGHEVGYRYWLTSKFPVGNAAKGTSIATECAGQMLAAAPLPVLALRVEAYNDRYPGTYSAMRVDSIDDLLLVLERGKDLLERDAVEDALSEYAKANDACDVEVYDRRGLLAKMRGADATAQQTLASHLADRFRFVQGSDEGSARIRAQYGINRGDAGSPGARAAFVATAIKQQVAQCVSVMIGNGTDTHFVGNTNHADALYPGIAALAALIDDLAKSDAPPELARAGGPKWLDHTTILAFSEFARTPLFNQFNGRDHHLTSSCLVAGAGIAGNQVIGESGEVGMGPGRYDFAAGRVTRDGGENILPEHVAATLLASAGLDPWSLRDPKPPIQALLARR